MPKPRILIFIDWFLPGYKAGGPIQSCANMVEHLKNEYDFWVITRDTDYCETEPYTTVKAGSWNMLSSHLQVYYVAAPELKFSVLRKAAAEVRPDIIFINGIYSFYFSVLPLRIAKYIGCSHVIVSARGMLAPSAIQVKGSKKKWFLRFTKLIGLYREVRFHATNSAEQEHILQVLGQEQEVMVAPNLAKSCTGNGFSAKLKRRGELNLVSIGRISPEKNTLFALQLLKQLKPDTHLKLDIFGPVYDEAYWQECQSLIGQLRDQISVTYHGSIENDLVHTTLQQYHALLLPTKGENFGHIILESFVAGLPVIISDQTPWRNLRDRGIGYDLSLSAPESFVTAIYELADMPDEQYQKMTQAAFAHAQEFISDPKALEQYKVLFRF
ncbi:glycosyltransferase family 4 protein [Pontibacter pudoricolor]|uniref:glycosyltransferase family 4 protein n=1 Tax=Pontibacter pudoricolor TaxID=2694930 RepID=UPI0013907411|nr:glycosyltransferase family 4 protein [Pontibacter pudoricolor]